MNKIRIAIERLFDEFRSVLNVNMVFTNKDDRDAFEDIFNHFVPYKARGSELAIRDGEPEEGGAVTYICALELPSWRFKKIFEYINSMPKYYQMFQTDVYSFFYEFRLVKPQKGD